MTRDGHYGASVPIDFGWLYQALMETYGGSMMSADGQTVGLDSEASVNAVRAVTDMVNKDKSMPLLQLLQTFESMAKGDVSMLANTTAGLGQICRRRNSTCGQPRSRHTAANASCRPAGRT
ncbi:hypothetical protein HMSSN036_66200 [Paenibacillus macerans]|nr:hypothetical protein HMSSN036_66200 [Paenibacillus macerans]